MYQRFLKNSLIYSLVNIIPQALGFLLLPFFTRVLSPIDFGVIEILIIWMTFVKLTLTLGISQGLARYLPESMDTEERIKYSSTALLFTIFIYGIFILIAYMKSSDLSRWITGQQIDNSVIQIVIICIGVFGIFNLVQSQLCFGLRSKLYAAVSLISSLVSLCLAAILVIVLKIGLIGFFYGQLSGYIIGSIIALYFNRRDYRLMFDFSKFIEMIRFSLPLVPSSLGVFFAQYFDRIAINKMLSIGELGVFSIGYRLTSFIGLIMLCFNLALTPLIYSTHRNSDTPYELVKIFRYFVVMSLLVFLAISFFAREILMIFVTNEFRSASQVIPFLFLAVLFSGMYIFAPGLNIAKKTIIISAINISGAIINLFLNFKLIPLLGIQGAAIATCTSAFVVFYFYMFFSQKFYYVGHGWKSIVLGFLISLFLVAINTLINFDYWIFGIITKISLMCLSVFMFLLIGLLQRGDFKNLMNTFFFYKHNSKNFYD